jgi:hypothetical protein
MKFLSVEHKGWPDYRNMSNVDMKTNLLRLERYDYSKGDNITNENVKALKVKKNGCQRNRVIRDSNKTVRPLLILLQNSTNW